jgi:Prohead core protein serine protease
MKLLLDAASSTEVLSETLSDGNKRLYIAGPFLMFDKPNRNKRVYPQKIMDEAVKKYTKEYIDTCRSLGEMNHPPGRLTVDPERACIMTTSLEKDGSYYYGKAKVLSTPLGKILENLLEDGVKIGVSSRGSTTKRGNHDEVKNDFNLTVAADCVWDPSVADAFVNYLMEEREFLLIDGHYVEKDLFEAKTKIKKAPSFKLEEAKIEAFKQFMDSLSVK